MLSSLALALSGSFYIAQTRLELTEIPDCLCFPRELELKVCATTPSWNFFGAGRKDDLQESGITKAMVCFMLFYAHWPRLSPGFQPTF